MTQSLQILQLNENNYTEQPYTANEMSRILGGVNNVASFAYFHEGNRPMLDLMYTHLLLDMYQSKGISGEHADLGKTILVKVIKFFEDCSKEFQQNKQEQAERDQRK